MDEVLKSITKKKGDVEKRVTVEEIENGFLVIKHTEWQDEEKGWQSKCEKYYSETDPFQTEEGKELADHF